MYKTKHFALEELVSPTVYKKYGEFAWNFFDPNALKLIDYLREKLDASIVINNWKWGGDLTQRGLRENTCDIVSNKTKNNVTYVSAHLLGKGFDFNVEDMKPKAFREWIVEVSDELPIPIRVEDNTATWNHVDVYEGPDKVTFFNA